MEDKKMHKLAFKKLKLLVKMAFKNYKVLNENIEVDKNKIIYTLEFEEK